MQSVLGEISALRKGAPILIDYHNSNRYRLVVREDNGSKTAYYFSTPIYNQRTRKLVDMQFQTNGSILCTNGSNANITIAEKVLMENTEGVCAIELTGEPTLVSSREILCSGAAIAPTINGIAIKFNSKIDKKINLMVDVGQPFLSVRANDKCVALMKEQFRPFVVFSCIGSLDATGNVIAPAKIEYQKLTDKRYQISVFSTSPLARYILLETNLYENKLFQDTTVESANPSTNNVFGSVGFIGNTSLYGEQWLYSKLDYSKMPEIMDKRIQKAVLNIPKLNENEAELSAFKVSARFCSFGSNWNNKIAGEATVSDSFLKSGYYSLDLTSSLVDPRTKTLSRSEGLILKPKVKGTGFSVITTGDSCYAPQIMEINYR